MAGVAHHGFSIPLATFSLAIACLGIAVGFLYYFRDLGPHGLTQRSALARTGYTFLENKYYLDRLYTDGVVGSIKGPIARAAYWVNQNVIDAVVNGAGTAARRTGLAVYDVIDQGIVDGAVNGAGVTASESGGLLRTMQTGRIQQYAAVLFAATAAFAIALVVFK
jgi:NADH-quinone oxidoreductase subunit L